MPSKIILMPSFMVNGNHFQRGVYPMKTVLACFALLLIVIAACSPAPTPEILLPTEAPATSEPAEEVTDAPAATEVTSDATAENEAVTATATQTTADAIATSLADDVAVAVVATITPMPTSTPTTESVTVDLAATIMAQEPVEPLRFGVLPVINALPLYVAETEGFYQDEGVSVDIVTFGSAREREDAMQAGTIHGETTDIVSIVLLNNAGFNLRAVRWDTTATPFFSILVASASRIQSVEDLRNTQIAVAQNTIIDYMTWSLLREAGLSDEEIRLVNVASISRRIEAINNGQVAAATLPEPITAIAAAQGARVVAADSETDVVPTVLAFDQTTLEERGEEVEAFLRAYERAVEAINANPEAYTDLFQLSAGLPEAVRTSYPVPTFRTAGIMSEEQFNSVMTWMQSRNMLRQQQPYAAYVDPAYLP
jgi:NitT/TauT family transport system substrate-binding protein